ncbi:hypothetical protein IPZ58_28195 [Streptomyces roseoverticillatus]|uniref:hypothetical protein n=1 Tax=Streptomyces roseoverticillatus TaxID=66429 RepID=UPI001F16FDAD|nr:hypothetical protein [Streptomyces roseoverticillatus]MCF3105442.1 hypothetical protein [Streptomyces roseoverticillatus]
MYQRHLPAAVLVLAVAALTGCSSSPASSTAKPAGAQNLHAQPAGHAAGGGSLPTGPGPQARYTVQKQPARGTCHYRFTPAKEPLPDPACTPGAVSPAVTQANLKQTICNPAGYTKGIRPPVAVTGPEKTANAASYGYKNSLHDAEYDHLVSLELGGDPNDPRNLWVEPPSPGHQPGRGPNNPKDQVESRLHTAICSGQVQLRDAQQAIATDWTSALSRFRIK